MATSTALELIAVEVRADIDQLVRDMPAAARVVDQGASQMDRSVRNVEQGFTKAGGASRVLGQQLSQVGQQALATGNVLQAIAIQLPDIAIGMSAAAGETSKLAAFLGGPWGTALVLATSVAIQFIPELIKIGTSAADAGGGVEQLTKSIERLAAAQGKLGDIGRAEAQVAKLQSERLKLTTANDRAPETIDAAARRERIRAIDKEISSLQSLVRFQDAVDTNTASIKASDEAAAEAKRRATATTRAHNKELSEAAKAAREAAAAQRELVQTLEQITSRFDPARSITRKFDETMKDIDKLLVAGQIGLGDAIAYRITAAAEQAKALTDEAAKRLTSSLGYEIGGKDDPLNRQADALFKKREEQEQQLSDKKYETERRIADIRDNQIRTAADLYESLFRGGTQSIWSDFEQIGQRVIARVLAQFTIAQIGGGSFNLGSALSTALSATLGFAGGGSFTVGGRGGTDRNTLSLNGRPIANVSRGEKVSVSPNIAGRGPAQGGGQTIYVDARGAVMAETFASQILGVAKQYSAQAGQQAYAGAVRDAPIVQAKRQRYGN